jgi:hypothetical protein
MLEKEPLGKNSLCGQTFSPAAEIFCWFGRNHLPEVGNTDIRCDHEVHWLIAEVEDASHAGAGSIRIMRLPAASTPVPQHWSQLWEWTFFYHQHIFRDSSYGFSSLTVAQLCYCTNSKRVYPISHFIIWQQLLEKCTELDVEAVFSVVRL